MGSVVPLIRGFKAWFMKDSAVLIPRGLSTRGLIVLLMRGGFIDPFRKSMPPRRRPYSTVKLFSFLSPAFAFKSRSQTPDSFLKQG
jgi:hypothetical protein